MKLFLFGTGSYYYKYAVLELEEIRKHCEIDIIGFVDNNKMKIGHMFEGKPIISVNDLEKYQYDYIYLSSSYDNEIMAQLVKIGLGDRVFSKSRLKMYVDNVVLNNAKPELKGYLESNGFYESDLIYYDDDLLNDITVSRFFTYKDKKVSKLIFDLPNEWWSRFYEYSWATSFVREGEVCLDAACGIEHPLKFYLNARKCKTYACDIDEKIIDSSIIYKDCDSAYGVPSKSIVSPEQMGIIEFSCMSLDNLVYNDNFFDKVFCISVLEHLPVDIFEKALKEFYRILKREGQLIITFDYPLVNLSKFTNVVKECGFKFYSRLITQMPVDAIYSDDHGSSRLYCYRVLLKK